MAQRMGANFNIVLAQQSQIFGAQRFEPFSELKLAFF